jgi:hypothetical protein
MKKVATSRVAAPTGAVERRVALLGGESTALTTTSIARLHQ